MATESSIKTRRMPVAAVPALPPTLRDLPTLAGWIAIGVGIVVLLGWLLNVEPLKSMVPGVLSMKANTAVCFVLVGIALVLRSQPAIGPIGRATNLACLWATLAIALVTGAQYAYGGNFGFDQLLFREPAGALGPVVPGRMAPSTVLAFTALSSALILGAHWRRTVIVLAVATMSLAYLSVLDFLFDAQGPTILAASNEMAVNTAVTMAIVSAAALAGLGPANPFAVLAGSSPTAVMLRRLLILSVVAPVALAWLRLEGQWLGLYDTSYGTSLIVVAITAVSVIAITHSGRWAHRVESARRAIEIERDELFDLSADLLAVFGADGRFRRVNQAWQVTLGYRADELIGRPLFDLIHPEDLERTTAEAKRHFGDGERVHAFANRYRHRDGSYRWLEWMSRMHADNSVAFAVARDITERKSAEDQRLRRHRALESRNEKLSDQALRDALTGLFNRRHFDGSIVRLEKRWRRVPVAQRPPIAVILFDLDHFGALNKLHGHQTGDAVLRTFAAILKSRFRESDLVARYGGEEFVAVLEGATSADAVRVAEDVRTAFAHTFESAAGEGSVRSTVSAGCAQVGEDLELLAALSVADVWLSQAKRGGRNQVVGL
ncbi:MAG: hypothetical protein QOF49_129 [Chloroflexota bacterium]|jgi:diguanylate cyclase (GGDEF)-like protein/PAS domain S-box-containing protein|nr:hypothetical protein [Chloroflexota bacterium]